MMKRLATTAIVLAIVSSTVFSQAKNGGFARQIALGGSNVGTNLVLNPFIMDDPALIYLNPAYQANYKDYGWLNVAGGGLTGLSTAPGGNDNGYGHQNAGISFAVTNNLSLGMILSYDPSFTAQVSSLLSGVTVPGVGTLPAFSTSRTPQAIPAIANTWELVSSYELGDLDLGLAFLYGTSNNETKTSVTGGASTETEASSSVMGIRAGVNWDFGGGSSIDGAVAFRMDNATDNVKPSTGGTSEYSASGDEITFTARGKLKLSNKFSFVPYVAFATVSAEPKEDAIPTGGTPVAFSEKITGTAMALGLGGEIRTPTFYLAGGLSFQNASAEVEITPTGGTGTTAELTYTAMPVFNIGGEWWFTDWMAGRGGYYRALASVKNETSSATGSSETTVTIPHSFLFIGALGPANYDGLVTLGLGFRFGGFALDATVSEEALRRGLGLIGSQDNINTFGYITTSFNFE